MRHVQFKMPDEGDKAFLSFMKKLKTAAVIFIIISVMLPLFSCTGSRACYESSRFDLFDTVCTLRAYTNSRSDFDKASSRIFDLLERLNKLFDIYNSYENINNIKTVNDNAGINPVTVDADIIGMLNFSLEMYETTGGSMNIMIGALTSVWHRYREADANALPSEEELSAAAEHIDISSLVIDSERSAVYISDPEASLDVGAVAKGYAAKLILELLPETEIESAVINLGGNIVTYGTKPDGSLWRVAVEKADSGEYIDTYELADMSVVTSGDYQRYYTVNGVRYHHIIDPETLYPVTGARQVSVICDDPALADAMSTALFVMDAESGDQLAEKYRLFVIRLLDDGRITYTGKNAGGSETSLK